MRVNLDRTHVLSALVLVIVVSGVAGSVALGSFLIERAEGAWRDRALRDAVHLTDVADLGLSQAQASLRVLGALFHGAPLVDEGSFESAVRVAKGGESTKQFEAIAYAWRVDQARRRAMQDRLGGPFATVEDPSRPAGDASESFVVSLTSQPDGMLAKLADLTTQNEMRVAVTAAYKTPDKVVMSSPFKAADGREKVILAFAAPNLGGEGVLVALMDLTEFFHELLFSSAPVGLHLRLAHRETEWGESPELDSVIGDLTPAPDTLDTFIWRITHGQARWQFNWDVLPTYSGGQPGQFGWAVMISGTAITLLIGALVGLMALQNARIVHSVNERTTELARARDMAELANRTKTEFLANMSHELRTPLNAVIGFSDIMKSEMLGPVGNLRYRQYARDIYDSGVHLLDVINDILDVSKAEAGKLDLDVAKIDLFETVTTCLRLVSERAIAAEVAIIFEPIPAEFGLKADERRVKQILLNLLSNAIKFTMAGGKVTVECRVLESGEGAISVTDTGIGIAPEDIPRALAPFGQVDSSVVRKFQGTGLGLPLSRHLAEMHGGRLAIESALGSGTVATVFFPAERVVRPDAAEPAKPADDEATASSASGRPAEPLRGGAEATFGGQADSHGNVVGAVAKS